MYESFKNTELPEKKCQHSTEIPEGEAFSNTICPEGKKMTKGYYKSVCVTREG